MAKPDRESDTSSEWEKHLRRRGKRIQNKKVRKNAKKQIKQPE